MDWKLNRLQYLLDIGVKLNDSADISTRLVEASEPYLKRVLVIFKDIIASNAIDYFEQMHKEEIHKVLERGSGSDDKEINKIALKIVNILGEKGYRGYEKYLPR